MDNLIVWADIPVADLDRAMKFYGAVLQREFITIPGMDGVALPGPDEPSGEGDGGAPPEGPMPVAFDLVKTDSMKPSMDGCQIYLNADEDPEGMLQRAADAGGEILSPLQDMGEMVGWIGFFKDTEGNRIGVHKAHS
jgi:predicted enzyme related to lactoylglutathione lyase